MVLWWSLPETHRARPWEQRHRTGVDLPRPYRIKKNRLGFMAAGRRYVYRGLKKWKYATWRDCIEMTCLRGCDAVNSIWLAYIVCGQTLGTQRSCDCWSANWGPGKVILLSDILPHQYNDWRLRGTDTWISKMMNTTAVQVSKSSHRSFGPTCAYNCARCVVLLGFWHGLIRYRYGCINLSPRLPVCHSKSSQQRRLRSSDARVENDKKVQSKYKLAQRYTQCCLSMAIDSTEQDVRQQRQTISSRTTWPNTKIRKVHLPTRFYSANLIHPMAI